MESDETHFLVRRTADSTELYHWGLKKGEESKHHKYIARVEIKKGKYRYFYSKTEYQNYLKQKSADLLKKIKDAVKDLSGTSELKNVDEAKENYKESKKEYTDAKLRLKLAKDKANLDGKVTKKERKQIDKYEKAVSKAKKSNAKAKSVYERAMHKYGNTPVGYIVNKAAKSIKTGEKFISDLLGKKASENKHKYVAKVVLNNGKYRYFYSSDEYERYLKRLQYQEEEPDFMKDLPKISNNKIYSSDEDMSKVNERYNPYSVSTSENCSNCSAAYELRCRGYDVEAKANGGSDDYNGHVYRAWEYFKDPEVLYVNEDGSTFKASEKFLKGESTSKDSRTNKYKKEHEYWSTAHFDQSGENITKAIKDNNPPGSRGFIDVTWSSGGGHSLIYEVDKKGNVTIKDSQTYDTYSPDELTGQVDIVMITRTDNLELKKSIKDAVVANEDNDREYRTKHEDGQYVLVKE